MPPQPDPERRDRRRAPLNPYLREVLRGFRATFASVFAFSFFINLLTLVVPLYLLQIYARVLPSGNIDTLIFLTAMALAAVVALGLLEAIRRALLAKAGARFERRVSEHLLDSAIRRAIAKSRPSINALRDLATVRGFMGGSSVLPLLDLPWSPLFILILFVLHPVLGLIGVCGALVMFTLALLNERVTREPLREAAEDPREMLDGARAYVRNADVIEAMGLRGELLARWNERGADATVASYRASRVNTRLASLSRLVRLFLQIGVIAAAAYLITRGELTAGATIASVLLLRRAISPIEQSIRSWKSVLSAREAMHTISEYLDHASTLSPDGEMPTPEGSLRAERVSLRPSGASRALFSRVDLELPPGTLTALTGPTAAGKSTLLRVLAGVVPPTSGRVTLGGYDLAHWHATQRGPHIGYLPQDVSLFPVTVRENIARLADAPIATVVDAARRAGAHELIQALPEGYDTLVDEDGANLSGGQRQRIGLARALFGEPKVVLLDEPDANLDAEGRSALRKSLRRLRRSGVAVLAITHHASLEKTADRVYRLEGGKVRPVRRVPERELVDDGNAATTTDADDVAAESAEAESAETMPESAAATAEPLAGERLTRVGALRLASLPMTIAGPMPAEPSAERVEATLAARPAVVADAPTVVPGAANPERDDSRVDRVRVTPLPRREPPTASPTAGPDARANAGPAADASGDAAVDDDSDGSGDSLASAGPAADAGGDAVTDVGFGLGVGLDATDADPAADAGGDAPIDVDHVGGADAASTAESQLVPDVAARNGAATGAGADRTPPRGDGFREYPVPRPHPIVEFAEEEARRANEPSPPIDSSDETTAIDLRRTSFRRRVARKRRRHHLRDSRPGGER